MVKYNFEQQQTKMVLGTLVYIIIIIVVVIVIIALLKFLFQLFFIMPIGTDYSADLQYAKEILLLMKQLNDIMFDWTIFMIIMSWPSAAYNRMISCDLSTTGKAKSILLQINHFQYAINFFVRIDDQWKNQVINQYCFLIFR